jgi:sugar (pentulose or hexulose) kinase
MEETLLSLDCGTQSLRAMLFTKAGKLLDKAGVAYEPYLSPRPGWAEQDAGVYWAALRNTPVLVDAAGEPVRPALLWLDTRKAGQVYRPGWAMSAVYGAMGVLPVLRRTQEDAKTNWVRQHQRELWERTAKVLQVSGYLNHRLTGRFRDSTACQIGHLPFNYRALRWCRPGELNARLFPVESDKLPELVAPGTAIGRITRAASAATGLPEGLPVIACASDKGAESLGSGCTGPAMASLSLGTAAAVQTTSPRYFEPLAFMPAYPAALPGQDSPEVLVFRGYWMIRWFLREFAGPEGEEARARGIPPEQLLDRFLREIPAGSLGLMTLPHWGAQLKDPAAKGSMIGLGEAHTRGHGYRSLIEGLGVALLTAAGVGLHGSIADPARMMLRPGRVYVPRADNTELYRKLDLKLHRRIQRRLEPLHAQIRQILNYPERSAGPWRRPGGKA